MSNSQRTNSQEPDENNWIAPDWHQKRKTYSEKVGDNPTKLAESKLWEIGTEVELDSKSDIVKSIQVPGISKQIAVFNFDSIELNENLNKIVPDTQRVILSTPEDMVDSQGLVDSFWANQKLTIELVKKRKPKRYVLLSYPEQFMAGLFYSVLQSLQKEIEFSLVWYVLPDFQSIDSIEALKNVLQHSMSSLANPSVFNVQCEAKQMFFQKRKWTLAPVPNLPMPTSIKKGVYWIVGGNGGIGKKIAQFLAQKYQSTIVISGRSASDEDEFDNFGDGKIIYKKTDSTNLLEMESLHTWILNNCGPLVGVINAAGLLRDKSMFFKRKEDVAEVMLSKIETTLLLDEVTKDDSLDFFLLFSSITSKFGNPGQTDYAAANVFLNQFANRRHKLVQEGKRQGDSLSVAWPYWEKGGMQLNHDQVTFLENSLGTGPLSDKDGLQLFEHVIQNKKRERCFLFGDEENITNLLQGNIVTLEEPTTDGLKEKRKNEQDIISIRKIVRTKISEVTKLPEDEMQDDEHVEEFGIDSILSAELCDKIEAVFPISISLSDIQFYSTINTLSQFILDQTNEIAGKKESNGSLQDDMHTAPLRNLEANQDIAIVGINLKVSNAENMEELWNVFMKGDSVGSIYPEDRWNDLPTEITKGRRREDYFGGFLNDVSGFDFRAFKVSPREAMLMDPQHRLLMQSVWQAIENAGYSRRDFSKKSTSVFVSIDTVDYEQVAIFDHQIDQYRSSGTSRYIAANRISHFFDLRGVSEPVNTACSGFFVGIDRAIDLIQKGISEQAVVSAVQLNITPGRFTELKEKKLISSSNKTSPFDEEADGFIRSEGVGTVILKPLQQALENKDHVYAVIKGAGVWHAGKSVGLTTPNPEAHCKAIQLAMNKGKVSFDNLAFIEAHGTGMPLGDISEIDAFSKVLEANQRTVDNPCIIGTSKQSLGHLEAASGVAVLAKAILCLQKGIVPGIPGLKEIHSKIDLKKLVLSSESQVLPQRKEGEKNAAGIHSYGLGGVSAFVVLEGFENTIESNQKTNSSNLFVLSAHTQPVLQSYLKKVLLFLQDVKKEDNEFEFNQFIQTYQLHRDAMKQRIAIVASDFQGLKHKIEMFLNQDPVDQLWVTSDEKTDLKSDEAGLQTWINEAQWNLVAEAWVSGANVTWPDLNLPRCPCPEYPFNNDKKLWIHLAN